MPVRRGSDTVAGVSAEEVDSTLHVWWWWTRMDGGFRKWQGDPSRKQEDPGRHVLLDRSSRCSTVCSSKSERLKFRTLRCCATHRRHHHLQRQRRFWTPKPGGTAAYLETKKPASGATEELSRWSGGGGGHTAGVAPPGQRPLRTRMRAMSMPRGWRYRKWEKESEDGED